MNYRVCFTAYLRRHGRRESTVRIYIRALDEFCKYSERAGRRLSMQARLRPEQVELYKQYLLRERGPAASDGKSASVGFVGLCTFSDLPGHLKRQPPGAYKPGRESVA